MTEARTMTAAELNALPIGSVIMTVTEPASFGFYEQRVWQKFGGSREWQFGVERHDWQSTDGGIIRVGNAPDFYNRKIVVLFEATPEIQNDSLEAHDKFLAIRKGIDG